MENSKIIKKNSIYFIGIGGISMSALAKLAYSSGYNVVGSNLEINEQTKNLIKMGIKVYYTQEAKHITKNISLVVYTGAIKENNPELVKAKELNIKIMERSEFLGEIANNYKKVFAISGTHGKTTTTAMIGEIFIRAGLDPTIHLGGEGSFGNIRIGGDIFITEACEYRNSFLKLNPDSLIITNIETDHLDYFKNLKHIQNSFYKLASQTTNFIITNNDVSLDSKIKAKKYVCGLEENCDFYAYNISQDNKKTYFDVKFQDKFLGKFIIKMFGIHNVKNALMSIAFCYLHNIEINYIFNALYNYGGVKRRNENVGEIKNVPVIADYAHHPTEIKAILSAYSNKKTLVVFQPHTYSRTRTILKDFSKSFLEASFLIIYKTYPAREEYDKMGDEKTLFNSINKKNKILILDIKELKDFIIKNIDKYDVCLVLGAGDIYDQFKTNILM